MSDELCCAVEKEDPGCINVLLHSQKNPDTLDKDGRLPLILAVGCGNLHVVKMLLEAGCTVNKADKRGRYPLHEAATSNRSNSADIVRLLLEVGADPDVLDVFKETPLMTACYWSCVDVVRLIASCTQNINWQSPTSQRAAIHYASMRQSSDVITALLDCGADPNILDADYETPLIIATRSGDTEVVQALLDGGCGVDSKGFMQYTALHWAVHGRLHDIVKLLLDKSAFVRATNCLDRTPLHIAASTCQEETCVKLLLEAGACTDAVDAYGETPLTIAARCGNLSVARHLLHANANTGPAPSHEQKKTPLTMALDNKHSEIAQLIIRCGCSMTAVWSNLRKSGSALKDLELVLPSQQEFITKHIQSPHSLQNITRFAIRGCMSRGIGFLREVESLPIPDPLKEYVTLTNVLNIA